jgi:hypothetical protein
MVPRFCHDRTSPVSLVLSPVTRIACFLSIQFTHENKCMHGCRYALNGTEATLNGSQCLDLMYDQTVRRWVGCMWFLLVWNGLASSVDGSWHVPYPPTRTEQIHGGYYRYTRTLAIKDTECVQPTGDCFIIVSYFYCTALRRVQHWGCHTIVIIESFRSEYIYWRDFFRTHLLVQWVYHQHRISALMFKSTSNDAILPSRAEQVSISSLLHRCVGIYTNKTISSS